MNEAFSWVKPNGKILEKARAFCYNKHPFSAMVGGIRNAKTTAACRRTIFLALAFPGNKGLMGRYESTSLKITTLAVFKDEIKKLNDNRWGPGPIIRKVNETESFVELNNDSLIYWRHLDEPEDAQGTEWGSVHIDELHECKEDTFNQIKARMTYWNPRRVAEFKANKTYMRMQKEFLGFNVTPKAYFYVTQNPDTGWTKKRIKENKDKEFFVIESTTQDNIENLPPDWWDSVKDMPDEWKKKMLEGSWDIAGGQVYKEFSTSTHVIDEFKLPYQWERLTGMDFGLRHPTTYYWIAVDEYGNLFIYDEHYKAGLLPEQHSVIIHAKSDAQAEDGKESPCPHYWADGKKYYRAIADPSGRNRNIINGAKLFDEYLQHGIACEAANHDFPLGYTRVSQYLHVDPSHVHPITGQMGSPRLFIFRHCVNAIAEFIAYEWENVEGTKDRAASEKPKKVDDDAMDAIRYVLVTRPEPSKIIKKQEPMTRMAAIAANAFTAEEREESDEVWN